MKPELVEPPLHVNFASCWKLNRKSPRACFASHLPDRGTKDFIARLQTGEKNS
jgi:hypothetical protein